MNGSKVIGEDMQRERSGKVRFLFGKPRRQARESAHSCANGQIVSFNMGGLDQIFIWSTTNNFALNSFELTWTIPLPTFFGSPVVFDFPSVVDVRTTHKF